MVHPIFAPIFLDRRSVFTKKNYCHPQPIRVSVHEYPDLYTDSKPSKDFSIGKIIALKDSAALLLVSFVGSRIFSSVHRRLHSLLLTQALQNHKGVAKVIRRKQRRA